MYHLKDIHLDEVNNSTVTISYHFLTRMNLNFQEYDLLNVNGSLTCRRKDHTFLAVLISNVLNSILIYINCINLYVYKKKS